MMYFGYLSNKKGSNKTADELKEDSEYYNRESLRKDSKRSYILHM